MPKQQAPRESLEDYLERITREQIERAEQEAELQQDLLISLEMNIRNLPDNRDIYGTRAGYLNRITDSLNMMPHLIEGQTIVGPDELTYTYLMDAARRRDIDLVTLLLPFSNLAQPTQDFSNFLDFLVQENFQETEEDTIFLVALGELLGHIPPNIIALLLNQDNQHGNTPLIQAIRHQNPKLAAEFFMFLLALGADINTPNRNGIAPIFAAIEEENVAIISELIRNGVNLQTRDTQNETADSLLFDELRDQVNDYIAILDAPDSDEDPYCGASDADDEYSTDSDSE